jgi:hypothetical protein
MRVGNVYHNAELIVKVDDKIVMTKKRRHMAPGEMESLKLPVDKLPEADAVITVEVAEEVIQDEKAS